MTSRRAVTGCPRGTTPRAEIVLETEGENAVAASCRDAAGNESEDEITLTRNLPPQVAITEFQPSEKSTDEQAMVKILGTVDDPAAALDATNLTHWPDEPVSGTDAAGSFVIDGDRGVRRHARGRRSDGANDY